MTDTASRMRIAIYYAVWAALCAAVAGIVITLIHAWFFSYNPGRSAIMATLLGGLMTSLAIAAGQGAVALVTASLLARLGRTLTYTVLLGLGIGLFDFTMYFLQMAVPATELGWAPDIAILVGAAALITVLGSRTVTASGA
ncbi:MAG: hypothetical protein Q8Q14_12340 [Gemmatimonadales bacterium]|nr:hypothetical protein [Gemmatimonadales bacterium]